MIEVRDSIQSDIDFIQANAIEPGMSKGPRVSVSEFCKTGMINDKIIAVAGIVMYWPGFGHGWIMISKDGESRPISVLRCLRKMIDIAFKDYELIRLEASARVDFPKAQRMLEHLDFQREGCMRKYCPDGSDAWLYSKVVQ